MSTLQELREILDHLEQLSDYPSTVVAKIVQKEIERRRNAGRPSKGVSRKEQNRLSQQRFRDKKKGVDK